MQKKEQQEVCADRKVSLKGNLICDLFFPLHKRLSESIIRFIKSFFAANTITIIITTTITWITTNF